MGPVNRCWVINLVQTIAAYSIFAYYIHWNLLSVVSLVDFSLYHSGYPDLSGFVKPCYQTPSMMPTCEIPGELSIEIEPTPNGAQCNRCSIDEMHTYN